tara:strand:- start:595 stop:804 length:210 start_codon:yes stop_codon:yes gene_type:complete
MVLDTILYPIRVICDLIVKVILALFKPIHGFSENFSLMDGPRACYTRFKRLFISERAENRYRRHKKFRG